MWPAVAFLGLALQAPDAAPARLIPPAPPADIAALVAADPAADAAAAARMLRENGVPAEKRMAAAMAIAKAADRSPVLTVAEAIVACGGTCGGTRDLADLLAGMHDAAAADPAALALLEKAAGAPDDPLHLAACRAIAAMPAERRPAAFRDLSVRTVAIKAVPGAMQYDVKEIKAKPGEVLEITLANGDTMQHNLLVVLPGKMAEVGDECGLVVAGNDLDDAEGEPDGLAGLDAEHDAHLLRGTAPLLALGVDVPGALHLEVRVERPGAVRVDAGEQVLAPRQGADHGATGEVPGGIAGHPEVGDRQPVAGEGAVELGGSAPDGVTLRHAVSTPSASR